MSPKKLAVVATHPIQYQAPWFRAMAAHPEIDLQVFFCHNASAKEQAAAGFGVEFEWDRPLLDGYSYRFLSNVAKRPTIETFNGLDTPEIKKIIAEGKFDAVLVLGWNFKSAWQAMRSCWKTRTPVMTRGDSHLHTPRHPLKTALKHPFYSWFISRFDACLAVGQWSSEYYENYGVRVERIFRVPHVVDEQFFERESARLVSRRFELRKQWGLPENAVVFVFVGKFIDKKRPLDFVRAIAIAARQNPAIVGLMVGDGALRVDCERLVESERIPVNFTGFLNQSQIVQSFVAADTLVLPSDGGETWGLVVNEAMACARTAVVSDRVGCGPDLVVPGETGDVFPLGDVESLSEVLLRLADDPDALEAKGILARQRAAEKCSMEAAVDGILQAINAVKSVRR